MRHTEWKPQRVVLVADDDQSIWIVENPAVMSFPAAHVELAGKFDSAKKTIHVEKATPGAPWVKESPCSAADNCILFTANPA